MPKHATSTSFSKENPRPGPGRKKMTDDEKRLARLKRAAEYDYKRECAALMPLALDQIAVELEKKKLGKNDLLRVFESMRDSVHGRPAQTLQGPDGGPLVVSFQQMVAKVDGGKVEKI